MGDKKDTSLVPRPAGELVRIPPGAGAIIESMVNDATDIMRTRDAIRHKVGNCEFRESDYQQILIWAKAVGMTPEDFVGRLQEGCLRISDGALIDVGVQRIFMGIGLNLSQVPHLKELDCRRNKLTELDLSWVPQLERLDCGRNRLTELDLSHVPHLKELGCRRNKLTELDLSWVPHLKELNCVSNALTKLDLSHVPSLKGLHCVNNHLTKLDLSQVPNLKVLSCGSNHLTELDLSWVPQLKTLYCWGNELTELDISSLESPEPDVSCDPDIRIYKRDEQNPKISRFELRIG